MTDWKPQPSEKAEDLDILITSMFGIDRRESIKAKTCPCCNGGVEQDSFRDEISLKEFHISGLCQDCQDSVFS
jgi:hypothetical protein